MTEDTDLTQRHGDTENNLYKKRLLFSASSMKRPSQVNLRSYSPIIIRRSGHP